MRYFLLGSLIATVVSAAPGAPSFDKTVQPLLRTSCAMCHNEKNASGGLNVSAFLDPQSIKSSREGWERIVSKVSGGEMPPKGMPKPPPAQLKAFLVFVESEFTRVDRLAKPDPGRVTARRLNRAEYANTVRDLLGVEFSANDEFPPDDSGYGFDNIGDVLTVSPMLMQKYLRAAERIASRAVGADPLPKPGLFNKRSRVKRLGPGSIQLRDQIEFDAEYVVRVLITGHRGDKGKPVAVQISVDGKVVKTVPVESAFTLVNKQGGATQRTSEEVRLYLSEGAHTFRAEFLNDEFPAALTPQQYMNPSRNMFAETFEVAGPFESKEGNPGRKKLLSCDIATGAACIEKVLTPLVHRAFRRPVTKAEVAKFVGIARKASTSGYNPGESLQFAISAILISPRFLFRSERDPKPGTIGKLSDLELASRLSYFLWSSMPDDEILSIAEAGKLKLPGVLDAQMKRMLADPKASALAENFAGQWLETRSLDAVKPDPKKFPMWNNDLKDALRTETALFFEHVVRENRPITDFLNGRYTFLNDRLAQHYGVPDVKGGEFRRVELASDQRGGILTHGSVLTVSSYPSRTSVVLRGKYLLENILGAPPPAAPPDIPALDEAATGTQKSLRQMMETHRSSPVCASCHSRMDVLGFGLENYDAIGQWRTQDGKFPVDASGTFPNGKSFTTPAQMKDLLSENMPEFTRCLTEKMLTYALGRGVEPFDRPVMRDIVRQTADNEYRIQAMIAAIVRSVPFQARRGEAVAAPKAASGPKLTSGNSGTTKQEIASK